MHCTSCHRQRPQATFCVLCGTRLIRRPAAEVREELSRVEWLLHEASRWDVTLVSGADASRLSQFYSQQAEWLRLELVGADETHREVMTQPPLVVAADSSVPPDLDAVQLADQPYMEPSPALLGDPGAPMGPTPESMPLSVERAGLPPLSARRTLAAHPLEAQAPETVDEGAALPPVSARRTLPAHPLEAQAPETVDEGAALPPLSARRTLPAHPLEAHEPETVDERVIQEASAWSRVWKPFLTDSVGWFVGGFLILAGVYYLVADAWADMTSLVRAGTVFGLAAGWTLAFFAWAKFLLRREVTAPAGRMLERLAAAMAPLATVAVGPIHDSPVVFWPLVVGWTLVSAWLAHRSARRVDPLGATSLAAAFGLAALMMGTAPLVAGLGLHATWLTALPVGLAAWAFSSGPRGQEGAGRFLIVAFGWAVTLFAVRLEVALVKAGLPLTLTLLAPMLAAGVASVRWLAKPPTKAADALSVLVVMVQVGLLVASIDLFTPKPAFVVTALLGAWTAWSLAKERITLNSARWLPVAYVFAYLAYQRIDQIVPQAVRDAYGRLKESLGYSTAPLPASYGSVYAALFVIGVGLLSLRWARSQQAMTKREGDVLLDTTAVASAFSSVLAIASLSSDARPALIATPLLSVVTLLLALRSGRFGLTLAGTIGALCAAGALSVGLGSPVWVGAIALVLAAASIPALGRHRTTLSVGAALLGLWGLTVGLIATPTLGATMTVALSSLAMLAVARNLDLEELLDLAWAGPVLTVVVATRWLTPGLEPILLATVAVVLGGLMQLGGRWRSMRLVTVVAALSAVAWHALVPSTVLWPGVTMLIAAVALFLASRATEGASGVALETSASTMALATLLPAFTFPWPSPLVPQLIAGVVVVVVSVLSVVRGRAFRTTWIASVALVMALLCCVGLSPEALVIAMTIALLATPALVPAVTVPVASLVVSEFFQLHLPAAELPFAYALHAIILAAAGLLDRVPVVKRFALNGQTIAWPGVVMSALWLIPALAMEPSVAWLPMVVSLGAPVLWSFSLRRPGARVFATGLVALTAFWSPASWLVIPPLVALGVALSLRSERAARNLALDRLVVTVTAACALLCAAAALGLHAPWFVFVAWAVVMLVLPVGAIAGRLVVATTVIALAPSTLVVSVAVGALFVIAFALRHAPGLTARVLGARSIEWAQSFAAFSALTLAVTLIVREPSSLSQGVLVGSLVLTGLLLGLSVMVPLAMVVAAVNLPEALSRGSFELHPWSVWVALAAAALSTVLRRGFALEVVEEAWDGVGTAGKWLDRASWGGAGLLVLLHLPGDASLLWLAPTLVLLVTPKSEESAVAALLVALTLVVGLPFISASVPLALFATGLAWFGALRDSDASKTRLHMGWVLSLVSLALSADLHAWAMPLCWVLAAGTAWAVVRVYPVMRWAGWTAVWAASHAVLAWAGLALSTGAPKELILPWLALASILVAVRPALTPSTKQHPGLGLTLRAISIAELAAGMVLCPGGHGREAIAVVAAVGVSLWLAWRDAKEDEPQGVWLGVLSLSFGIVVARVLFGAELGLPEAVVAVMLAGLASVLSSRTADSVPATSKALSHVALWWPALGLLVAPWGSPTTMAGLLVAYAVHYTLLAQAEGLKATASVLAAVAFNGAVLTLWFGSGWGEPQYVLVPMGLSGLVLVQVFHGELGDAWSARLRALAVGLVYAAAAFRPLAIDTTWAFFLCVFLCVAGVGAGIALRIRSFVTLGTIFLVTTVVATLVRWGVREPRLGALFLSALGLAVVAFMVLVTTKKAELLERYKRVRGALERWEG